MFEDKSLRELRAKKALEEARIAKSGIASYWEKMKSYYDGIHETARETGQFLRDQKLPWVPAAVPDGYLHVENQVEAEPPDFEFSARGEKDSEKAALRERVVRYVVQNNDMTTKNAANERKLHLYGSAAWKVAVGTGDFGGAEIVIDGIAPETVFPDPGAERLDDCEYVALCYRMRVSRAERVFHEDLRRSDTTVRAILSAKGGRSADDLCDTCEVTEFWYKQETEGEAMSADGQRVSYQAGDIALSLLIEGREIRYVPKFWTRTSYKRYPLVIYQKIPRGGSLWGKSELEAIIPLMDAADRQMAFAQLNTAFFANDILVYEENAFASDSAPDNRPGAVWRVRPGMSDKVKRLGSLGAGDAVHYSIVERYRAMMKETLGNFDFLQGDSATQVQTATGLALLGDYANKRAEAKNICKRAGFERLYRLVDAMAMEVFDKEKLSAITDMERLPDMYGYLPTLDISVGIGEGIKNSRSLTLAALESLCKMEITAENYPVVRAYLNELGIPERAMLIDQLDAKFSVRPDGENITKEKENT